MSVDDKLLVNIEMILFITSSPTESPYTLFKFFKLSISATTILKGPSLFDINSFILDINFSFEASISLMSNPRYN